jgi:hypothetical protein
VVINNGIIEKMLPNKKGRIARQDLRVQLLKTAASTCSILFLLKGLPIKW